MENHEPKNVDSLKEFLEWNQRYNAQLKMEALIAIYNYLPKEELRKITLTELRERFVAISAYWKALFYRYGYEDFDVAEDDGVMMIPFLTLSGKPNVLIDLDTMPEGHRNYKKYQRRLRASRNI